MAKLIDLETRKHYALRNDRNYTLIGRHPEADIIIPEDIVSRFHATIIDHEVQKYLLDHSFNGTYYPVDEAGKINADRKLDNVGGSQVFMDYKTRQILPSNLVEDSHVEAFLEGNGSKVPRLVGYADHQFEQEEDIEYLLNMIKNPEERVLLLPMARRMDHETILAVTNLHRFLFLK
jgi:hypothetical protein